MYFIYFIRRKLKYKINILKITYRVIRHTGFLVKQDWNLNTNCCIKALGP